MKLLKNTKKSNIKKPLGALILAIILLVSIAFAYKVINRVEPTQEQPGIKQEINYDPPTEEEKQAGDEVKQRIVEQEKQQNTSNNQTGLKQVTPVISSASTTQVSAYISGVFEDGGVCTANFTQNETKVSRTSEGFTNVSYTQCAPITPDLPSGGNWTVTVSYKSSTAQGTSQETKVSQ